MQPLMKCNVCGEIFEPIDVPQHKHNFWTMVKRTKANIHKLKKRIDDEVNTEARDFLS